jgi:hypothetical protein
VPVALLACQCARRQRRGAKPAATSLRQTRNRPQAAGWKVKRLLPYLSIRRTAPTRGPSSLTRCLSEGPWAQWSRILTLCYATARQRSAAARRRRNRRANTGLESSSDLGPHGLSCRNHRTSLLYAFPLLRWFLWYSIVAGGLKPRDSTPRAHWHKHAAVLGRHSPSWSIRPLGQTDHLH